MENYSRESGREMSLNKYADCTEEEYLELTGQKQTEEVKAEEETEKVVVAAPVQETAASGLSKADAQALAKAEAKAKADAEKKARDEELAKKKAAQEGECFVSCGVLELGSLNDHTDFYATISKSLAKDVG